MYQRRTSLLLIAALTLVVGCVSPGVASENYLNPGTECTPLPSKLTRTFRKGEVFRHVHPGGGGFGDPLERDPALVVRDMRNGLLSAAKAAADYGVIVDMSTWTVEKIATERARADIRRMRNWKEVPKVQRNDPVGHPKAAE